ncbi:MAG: 16S rRNA (cytidine(1402)-2'-O)-methyltransferase [Calditrichaeota bacterium]|nr:MAG: 16S rRNA (cytidine(1402)-2'-O)-methyltransferase [Calditrichota bacterium]
MRENIGLKVQDLPGGAHQEEAVQPGTLYIISTPIGNLGDITLRAIRTLQAVDLIAAEDTRHSRKLLQHYQIEKPLVSFHDFNKTRQTPMIIRKLLANQSVGLISDAGTPGISDPGFYLIREALKQGIPVQAIPGVTALIPALILSGLPAHHFVFEGFPPAKKGRRTFFERLKDEKRTVILYESPHRLTKTLNDILNNWGDRNIAVARELTKKFEEVLRGRVSEILEKLAGRAVKGEIVLVVEGKTD